MKSKWYNKALKGRGVIKVCVCVCVEVWECVLVGNYYREAFVAEYHDMAKIRGHKHKK